MMLQRRGTSFRTASAAMAALFFSQSTGVAQVASRMSPSRPAHLGSALPPGSARDRMIPDGRYLERSAPPRTIPERASLALPPSVKKPSLAPGLAGSLSDSIEDGLLWLARRQAEGAANLDSLHDSIENGMLALALVQHRAAAVFDTVGLDLRESYRLWQKVAAAHKEEKSSTPSGRNPFIASVPGARETVGTPLRLLRSPTECSSLRRTAGAQGPWRTSPSEDGSTTPSCRCSTGDGRRRTA